MLIDCKLEATTDEEREMADRIWRHNKSILTILFFKTLNCLVSAIIIIVIQIAT